MMTFTGHARYYKPSSANTYEAIITKAENIREPYKKQYRQREKEMNSEEKRRKT